MAAKLMPQRNPLVPDGRGGPGDLKLNDLEERCKKYKQQLQAYEMEFQRMSQERQEMSDIRANMAALERTKENLRHQLSDYKRDNDRLTEKLALVTNDKRELERKVEQLNAYISQPSQGTQQSDRQSSGLQQVVDRLREENSSLRRERDELQEAARRRLDTTEGGVQRLKPGRGERDKSPLPHNDKGPSQSSSEDVSGGQRRNHTLLSAKFSQGSMDEEGGVSSIGNLGDIPTSDFSGSQGRSGGGSGHSGSGHSFSASRRIGGSTSNLYGDNGSGQDGRGHHTKLSEQTSRLQGRGGSDKKLEELSQQCQELLSQVSSLEQQKGELESKAKQLKQSLDSKQDQIDKLSSVLQDSRAQMEMALKQKSVALKENSASYEQAMKLQTSLQTMQVEKEILQTQHDVAKGERDKLVGENVALRKKMELLLNQRQKDAKDLSSMKLLKDKAVQEVGELRRGVEELQKEKHSIEEEMGVVRDQLRSSMKGLMPTSESVANDIEALVLRLVTAENEKRMMLRALFGHDNIQHNEAVRTAEKMSGERDSLLEEIEALQHTAGKEAEDRIFELKQKIENLMVEKERLIGQYKNLSKENGVLNSKLSKIEEDKDRLRDEIKTLTERCNSLESIKNRLIEEHTKTLERAEKLWKQRPINWDDAWEEKHIEFSMGPDGLAGFSVAGGRDQPQLPNPGAILITMVAKGSPADGQLKIGDVLETVNGVSLTCADHRDAVRAVKDSNGLLRVVVKRRKYANTIQVGITSVINGLEPHLEEQEFSLMVKGKDAIGFKYDWSSIYTVTEVTQGGPADQILKPGDKITKVNNTSITREKPSAVKKLMKPHHTILKLVIQREACLDEPRPQEPRPQSISKAPNPLPHKTSNSTGYGRGLSGSSNGSWHNDKETDKEDNSSNSEDNGSYHESQSPERCSHSEKRHSDGFSQNSGDSSRPTKLPANKLVAKVTRVRQGSGGNQATKPPEAKGEEEGDDYNERRIEYGDVLLSEATGSQVFDSYLSETCSYDAYPSSTSQSIDLTFHSAAPAVSHNRLTVDTMTATCPQDPPSQPTSDDDESSLSRNHKTRTTCIRKASFGTTKEDQKGGGTQDSTPKHRPGKVRNRSKSKSIHGSMSQVNEASSSAPRGRSRSSSSLNHGKSWSNLTHACSMTSVQEEGTRRSTSSNNVSQMQEHDPLTGATYIRANFTYIPRNPKEISVKPGNVFHIHDEEPSERFRASFWVSRLNPDGTDAQIGPIPNSTRAQQYVETQGETIDVPLYEEVEPFNQLRPVLIYGALADQVVAHLLESYPNLFYQCMFEIVEAIHTPGRLTEVRLNRELGEGKILDFRRTESGNSFAVLKKQALVSRDHKGQHCLLVGTTQALYKLKDVAPPISILIKVISQDSISTFTTKPITPQYAADTYKEVLSLINDQTLINEFSATIILTYMDTLMQQIKEVVKKEKQKTSWIVAKKSSDQ